MKLLKSGAIALSALFGVSLAVLGASLFGNAGHEPAGAADPLPSNVSADHIGEGGLELSSVRTVAETSDFQVWIARDRVGNICMLTRAHHTGDFAGYCGDDDQIAQHGISGLLQVGAADPGDAATTALQSYWLPDETAAVAAADVIDGAQHHGQLVTRYGSIRADRTTAVALPSQHGELSLTVFGRDALSSP